MAQFFAQINAGRKIVTRLGHKTKGMVVVAQGWDIGVRVDLQHVKGSDIITVWKTGGTNRGTDKEIIVSLKQDGA